MRNRTIKIGESRRKRRIRKNRRRFILFITLLSLSISFLIFYKWEKIDIKFYLNGRKEIQSVSLHLLPDRVE